jgi:hypothetical protein
MTIPEMVLADIKMWAGAAILWKVWPPESVKLLDDCRLLCLWKDHGKGLEAIASDQQ